MAQKPETKFRAKLQKLLDEIPNSWFESIQQKTIHGTPDILGCVNGNFVALEVKAAHDSPLSRLQEVKLKRIANANGLGFVVNPANYENVLATLNHLSRFTYDKTDLETTQRN